jgi:hypothetical protein
MGDAFFDMMSDFVNRYHDKFASTDDFRRVANEHFVRTPIAAVSTAKPRLVFRQWFTTRSCLHSHGVSTQDQPDGKVLLTGTITQETRPTIGSCLCRSDFVWKNQEAHRDGAAMDRRPFQNSAAAKPQKVELDPHRWVHLIRLRLNEGNQHKSPI